MEHGSAVTGGERAPGGQRGQLQECGLYPERCGLYPQSQSRRLQKGRRVAPFSGRVYRRVVHMGGVDFTHMRCGLYPRRQARPLEVNQRFRRSYPVDFRQAELILVFK